MLNSTMDREPETDAYYDSHAVWLTLPPEQVDALPVITHLKDDIG
jgi:hypothetical protein